VALAEPKIADAVVLSLAKSCQRQNPGHTTLLIWETGSTRRAMKSSHQGQLRLGQLPQADRGQRQRRRRHRHRLGETIVLAGSVKSAEDSKRLAGMAQTRAKTVINLLKAPPPPDPRQILLQVKFAAVNAWRLHSGFQPLQHQRYHARRHQHEQFASPRFSQLQLQNNQLPSTTVNFSDLLNLFAFRPISTSVPPSRRSKNTTCFRFWRSRT